MTARFAVARETARVMCIEAQKLSAHHATAARYARFIGSFAVAKVEQHKARLQHERVEILLCRLLRWEALT